MRYASCGRSIIRRKTGGFYSLVRGMRSMRTIRRPRCGPSDMNGPVEIGGIKSEQVLEVHRP